jgi:DNA-binding XRE family transcriptional regulator
MMRTALVSGGFVKTTSTSISRSFPTDERGATCVDPGKRELLAAIGLVKSTTNRAAYAFAGASLPYETSMDSLAEFARDLGLDADVREARKSLASHVDLDHEKLSLRILRLRAGLSQREVADAVGTSQSRISAIEAGREGMGIAFARKLSRTLGVSLDAISDATEGDSDG